MSLRKSVFSYAGMPFDAAERSMKRFADKVLPRLKQVQTPPLKLAGSA